MHIFSVFVEVKMCNSRQHYYMDQAVKMAKKSTMEHKHGAVIVHNNEIIATGFNFRQYYMCHGFSIHAEVDALTKVKGRKNILSEAELYVARIGKFNPAAPSSFCLKFSKPCRECSKAILKQGIRKVYYSTAETPIESNDENSSDEVSVETCIRR
jgi:deoxycytidylate deaminase